MVTKVKRRTTKRRRVRKNAKRRSTSTSRYSKANRKRPTLYKSRGKWYGSREGAVRSGTRINAKRKRRTRRKNPSYSIRRRRRYRRNPALNLKRLISKQYLFQIASIGGGIALGFMLLPLTYRVLPTEMAAKNRRFLGVVNVLIGGLMAGMLKNKNLKSMGITVAGTGVYDLIAANTEDFLGLPTIPESTMLITKMLPPDLPQQDIDQSQKQLEASYEVESAPVSPAAALGASYMPMGASYEEPDSMTVGLGYDMGFGVMSEAMDI